MGLFAGAEGNVFSQESSDKCWFLCEGAGEGSRIVFGCRKWGLENASWVGLPVKVQVWLLACFLE